MNDSVNHIGRLLVIGGSVIALIGLLFLLADRIPWLGRLPGDILIRKKSFTFYFPLATSIVISLLLTLVFWLIGRK